MSLETPENAAAVDNLIKTYVQTNLTGSNPFSPNHWLGAEITGISQVLFDIYQQLLVAIDQNLPDRALGVYLARWLVIFRISQLAATQSGGTVVAEGAGTIPGGTVFVSDDGNTYTSTSGATVTLDAKSVETIQRSGQVATATFVTAHELATGVLVTITGADQDEYNVVDTPIIVISATQYTYAVSGSPIDATGVITSTSNIAKVPIISDDTGQATNLAAGTQIRLQSQIAAINDVATVDFSGIGGGTDEEADEATRLRLLDRIQNPVAHFNASDITALSKTVPGVTRVFVQTPSTASASVSVNVTRMDDNTDGNVAGLATITSGTFPFISGQPVTITNISSSDFNVEDAICIITSTTTLIYSVGNSTQDPSGLSGTISGSDVPLGTVKVFFMRDNDEGDGIPDGGEVTAVRDLLLTILPANTSETDLLVSGPTPNAVDFTFTELNPNSTTMQAALITNLEQMFIERTTVGVNISSDIINNAIITTLDSAEGEFVTSFLLSTPTEIELATNEIGVLGEVVFP